MWVAVLNPPTKSVQVSAVGVRHSLNSHESSFNELRTRIMAQIGGNTRPVRVRVLDLPFTAVEWVLPSESLQAGGDPLTPAKWMVWDRSPLAKERSLAVRPAARAMLCLSAARSKQQPPTNLCPVVAAVVFGVSHASL